MTMFLETENLTKQFRFGTAVDHVDLKVEKGSIYGIVGREGSGKTTLLAMLSGLVKPTEGVIKFEEEGGKKPTIGLLLDRPALYEHLSAYDNLNIKRLMAGVATDECIGELLRFVGLTSWGGVKVKAFSPGMKQRLAIAMAMIGEPEILLLDEPLRDLDPQSIRDIKIMIRKMNRELGTTVIMTADSVEDLGGITTSNASLTDGRLASGASATTESIQDLPGYIRLIADPLSDAKKVLDEMEIFSYQTKSEHMVYVLEQIDRRDEMIRRMREAGVNVIECGIIRETYSGVNGGNGGAF